MCSKLQKRVVTAAASVGTGTMSDVSISCRRLEKAQNGGQLEVDKDFAIDCAHGRVV